MPYNDVKKQREYQRQWMAKRRAEFFIDKFCIVCGITDNLELDHIDPTAKVSHRIWSWSKERRDIEIKKCQILCKLCHAEKTNLMYPKRRHGTETMYSKYACRCDNCRMAHTVWRRERRARTGKD